MISFAPWATAAVAESLFHCWAIVVGLSLAFVISSQPIIFFPYLLTVACARSTNRMYCSLVSVCTSSPPIWKYGPGVIELSSRMTSSMKAYVPSLSTQRLLQPTSVPV